MYGEVPPDATAVAPPFGGEQLVWFVLVINTESGVTDWFKGVKSGVEVYVKAHPSGQPTV